MKHRVGESGAKQQRVRVCVHVRMSLPSLWACVCARVCACASVCRQCACARVCVHVRVSAVSVRVRVCARACVHVRMSLPSVCVYVCECECVCFAVNMRAHVRLPVHLRSYTCARETQWGDNFLIWHGFVLLSDANSVNVTPPQDTPVSNTKDGNYVLFGVDVEIQRPIERFPRGKVLLVARKNYDVFCLIYRRP